MHVVGRPKRELLNEFVRLWNSVKRYQKTHDSGARDVVIKHARLLESIVKGMIERKEEKDMFRVISHWLRNDEDTTVSVLCREPSQCLLAALFRDGEGIFYQVCRDGDARIGDRDDEVTIELKEGDGLFDDAIDRNGTVQKVELRAVSAEETIQRLSTVWQEGIERLEMMMRQKYEKERVFYFGEVMVLRRKVA